VALTNGFWDLLEKHLSKQKKFNLRRAVAHCSDHLTNQIHRAMATGNWVGDKAGVTRAMTRDHAPAAQVSCLCRRVPVRAPH